MSSGDYLRSDDGDLWSRTLLVPYVTKVSESSELTIPKMRLLNDIAYPFIEGVDLFE